MSLILASQSPRRQELLSLFGIPFEVAAANVNESLVAGESAIAMTRRLAQAKANHIFDLRGSGYWVLGGDTTVVLGNQVLGKPADRHQAVSTLKQLSGQTHIVISAVALVGDEFFAHQLSETQVSFCQLSDQQIENYCDTDEPFDKAGAYGIQGYAGSFISNLTGSYSGVVGLPLFETRQLLEQAGLT